ncbi:phage holin family protein [Georgenia sp. TF02-10]|uniref:phage holin family protein n=1 Tax=Georgenia sp. TF02-10 TaxID=2917725 RepID=UPI001FA7B5BC|nr:phage holin family protein [Georgenia sp. TF02-10]UNX54548.1 phage holin family protein [Georgenia sp. TF02-10]
MSTSAEHDIPPAGAPAPPETRLVDAPKTRSIGELFAQLSEQLSRLVRDEIQLAQTQFTEKGKRLGTGAAFLAVAGVVALYAVGVLLAAAILGLATALPAWLSALIVGVVLLIVAGIAALLGKKRLDAAKEVEAKPQEGLKEDVNAVKKGIQR